ncbi:MAG: hypothetical protein AAFN92_16330, partial [Bacteroidota bacterium]
VNVDTVVVFVDVVDRVVTFNRNWAEWVSNGDTCGVLCAVIEVRYSDVCATFTTVNAQCENWNDSDKKEEAENAHVAYRNFVKNKSDQEMTEMGAEEFSAAFENWQKAYTIAPAADGQRPFHYSDGRTFYRAMAAKESDAAKKKEYQERLLSFYDEQMKCYPKDEAYLLGRKGYDQFYLLGYSMDALKTLEMAMEKGGNKSEYIVLPPLGQLLNYYYKTEKLTNVEVRDLYEKGIAIADANIAEGGDYVQYYEDAKANLEASVQEYEDEIFDCAYFKEQLLPQFEENKEDLEILKYIYQKLTTQGCEETDADLVKVKAQYDAVRAVKQAEYEAERIANNPAYAAQKAYEEENFSEAIRLYQEAIDKVEEDEKKATYYYQMAQIQNAKLGQYGAARQNANKAASLKGSWGKPYILIGDIYGRLGRNCGDAYQQRLAVLAAMDKYSYAKSIDGEVASEANKRIANYRGSMPIKSEAFQRGDNAGDKIKVGCGIGETVTLRF